MVNDLECGLHHHHRTSTDQSCYYSQEEDDNEENGRCSCSSDCSVVQMIDDNKKQNGVVVVVVNDDTIISRRRDCRICQLSSNGVDDSEDEDELMELGCCCKHDLALAHKHCADTWFKIKGNKICEICNSIVTNLVVPNETPSTTHGTMDVNPAATTVATTRMSTATRPNRGCINGHRLLNFILACLVFAFVISWLFHFNIPS